MKLANEDGNTLRTVWYIESSFNPNLKLHGNVKVLDKLRMTQMTHTY